MDVNVTGTLSRVDKDTDTLSMTGTLSDPVIPAPPQLTAEDFGLVIGGQYDVISTVNGGLGGNLGQATLRYVNGVGVGLTYGPNAASGNQIFHYVAPWNTIVQIVWTTPS